MQILPTTSGTRPGLACELRPEGVVAARRADGTLGLMAVLASSDLPEGAFRPSLRPGSMVDRAAIVAAIRQVLDKVVGRTRQITLVVPDSSVRVLLLEFDALPSKPVEALPVVRFRLKKLLPFDADGAAISYQVMSSTRSLIRVVAVAMPREVLAEYESAVREAGFEPGAILPSTLAVLAGMDESDTAALLINAGPEAVTAAIVRGGILLLHRSVDMRTEPHGDQIPEPLVPTIPSELLANPSEGVDSGPAPSLPLVDREDSAKEWSEQKGAEEFLRDGLYASGNTSQLDHIPFPGLVLSVELPAAEIVQAVSVAAAYFEDTLGAMPSGLLVAGPTSATRLCSMLRGTPLEDWTVRETLDPGMLPPGQGPAGMPGVIPRGWLAGIQGALRG